ncbi:MULTISPECIES: ABC transporter permease [unclassified Phyllobacterium]|uniref:ABC transporter permease n=1 Tax=unclassified Phyllobacterium TaxID=2638441 RepID=UPI003013177B
MTYYILRRIAQIPVVLFVVTVTIFVVIRMTPGDPVQIMLGMQTSPEAAAALRATFRLDQPLIWQYLYWIVDLIHGDLGQSIRLNQPVVDLLAERLPISMKLASIAMSFAIIVSIPLGIISALKRNSWVDYLSTGITLLGFSIPNFSLALILIFIFSVTLEWLPITGIGSSSDGFAGVLAPYILPSLALGMLQVAVLTRLLRASMIEVLDQDYMRTARAKGLLPVTRLFTHALKNAMIPFVTMVAIQFGYLIGIQVTIEYTFAIPGMGSAILNAVVSRDFPVIQGFTLIIATFFLLANIIADVVYSYLDPRIRY